MTIKALELADELDYMQNGSRAADELRRLHEMNNELVKALKYAYHKSTNMEVRDLLRVIIHKATGEYI